MSFVICCVQALALVLLEGSQTNFTSLATPNQVGSGKTALVTLLHEGGGCKSVFAKTALVTLLHVTLLPWQDSPGNPAA
eukprot:scaffold178107_cov19-Tisochrysis_lutea.AAC.1